MTTDDRTQHDAPLDDSRMPESGSESIGSNHGSAGGAGAPDEEGAGADGAPAGPVDEEALRDLVIETIKTVYDPEIPVNIYELGMIYDISFDAEANAVVTMTLTSPSCPVAGSLPLEVEDKVNGIEGIRSARVDLAWDPPWTPDKISEAAKLELGIF